MTRDYGSSRMMPKCRDVAHFIASDGLVQANWLTRILVPVHRLYCKNCRRYAEELATIGRVSRETLGADSVNPERLQRLERMIMDLSSGHHEGQEDRSDDRGPQPN